MGSSRGLGGEVAVPSVNILSANTINI